MKLNITLLFMWMIVFTIMGDVLQGQTIKFNFNEVSSRQGVNFNSFQLNQPVEFMQRLSPPRQFQLKNHEKSSQAQSVKMDTAMVYSNWVNPKRYTYVYDTSGNKIASYVENTNNGKWVYSTMDTSVYDSVGNALSKTWKNWVDSTWINATRNISTYGANRTLLTLRDESWSGSSWVDNDSIINTYDSFGNLIIRYKTVWNDSTWVNFSYEFYVFDSLENLQQSYRQRWHDSNWFNEQRYSYTYDSSGNVLIATIANGDTSDWVNFYRESYTYDSAKNRISYIGTFWNDSTWTNSDRYNYEYDDLGRLVTATGEQWNDSSWVNTEQAQYTHEPYGGIESALNKTWKDTVWADTTLAQYVYDETGSARQGDYYTFNGTNLTQNYDELLQLSYNYNIDRAYFTGYQVDAHYVTHVATGIKKFNNNINSFSCSPNPTSGVTKLSFNLKDKANVGLYLYDISGKKIKTIYRGNINKGIHNFQFNIQKFSPGIYFVNMISGEAVKSIKIVRIK